MVFTVGQTTAFFENASQMGLENRVQVYLQDEGIEEVDDLEEFATNESWAQVLENCKRPPRINQGGALVDQAAFRIGAKSLRRLKVASKCVAYYAATGRERTANNMQWSTRLVTFEIAWKALEDEKKNESNNKLPILTKNFPIDRWLESYSNYATQRIGVRTCPLSYVIREEEAVPVTAPPLHLNCPYSTEHGSLKAEMVARYSHDHALFKTDNGLIFDDIEEATRGSRYQPTITPFKRGKNGRGAYIALRDQFAGPAMWDKKKSNAMEFLQGRKFTGTTNLTLEAFLGMHRSTFVTLQRCEEHVNCQLPDERSRVQYLLDNIQVEDSNVKAALSSVRMDDTANGMRNNFEAAVAFLLPTDPVERKKARGGNKRAIAEVSAIDTGKKDIGSHKPARGKTGVEFRYHKPSEFKKLSQDQVSELLEHRKNTRQPKQKGDKDKKRERKMRSSISSVVKTTIQDMVDAHTKNEEKAKAQRAEAHDSLIASLQLLAGKPMEPQVDARASAIEALKMLAGSTKGGQKEASVSALENLKSPGQVATTTLDAPKSVGILAAATRPKGKPMKSVDFAPIIAPMKNGNDDETNAAAARLMKLVYSMSSGERNGSP